MDTSKHIINYIFRSRGRISLTKVQPEFQHYNKLTLLLQKRLTRHNIICIIPLEVVYTVILYIIYYNLI